MGHLLSEQVSHSIWCDILKKKKNFKSPFTHPLVHSELLNMPFAECKCSKIVIYLFVSYYLFIIANFIP